MARKVDLEAMSLFEKVLSVLSREPTPIGLIADDFNTTNHNVSKALSRAKSEGFPVVTVLEYGTTYASVTDLNPIYQRLGYGLPA